MSLISVILPTFNSARFLQAAIASVLGQTWTPLELIVVDGGSTDETEAIARRFGAAVQWLAERGNVSVLKNRGLARARGEWIAFMGSDDEWLPEKLARQMAWLEAHPATDISITQLTYFLHAGCEWPANFPERLRTGAHLGAIPETLLCPREWFRRVGLFDETLETSEDVDWIARARNAGAKIEAVPEVLLRKGVHDRNISLTHPGAKTDLLRALRGSVRQKRDPAS